ncbi:unnamed protein product [Sphagnum troendelagicum]|uniref:Uncharacterized protein n=1 Tax=Sphagnum troendelagicum TaxID=128251 RepID=A0ABP0U1J7_9BRYO
MSTGHRPLRAARDRSLAAAGAVSMSTRHRPLRAARGRSPAIVVRLLSGCGGHAIHIILLAVNDSQPVLRGGIHRCLISDGICSTC